MFLFLSALLSFFPSANAGDPIPLGAHPLFRDLIQQALDGRLHGSPEQRQALANQMAATERANLERRLAVLLETSQQNENQAAANATALQRYKSRETALSPDPTTPLRCLAVTQKTIQVGREAYRDPKDAEAAAQLTEERIAKLCRNAPEPGSPLACFVNSRKDDVVGPVTDLDQSVELCSGGFPSLPMNGPSWELRGAIHCFRSAWRDEDFQAAAFTAPEIVRLCRGVDFASVPVTCVRRGLRGPEKLNKEKILAVCSPT